MTRITLTNAEIDAKISAAVKRKAAAEAAFVESQATIAKCRGKGPSVTATIQRAVDLQRSSKCEAAAAAGEIARLSAARKQPAVARAPSSLPAAAPAAAPAEMGQAEIVASLESMGVIPNDSETAQILTLARSVGLKGFADAQQPASQAEILASLESMGVIARDPEAVKIVELARSVGLKGFADDRAEDAQQQPASQREIVASLDSMGVIAKDSDAAEVLNMARGAGLKGFA